MSPQQPKTVELNTLFSMTWPMLIGVLSLMSFQLVDSIFISRLGVAPLAVVGFTIPIYQLIIGIQVGIGIATTALISQRLGAGNADEAQQMGGSIVAFGTSVICILCAGLWCFREDLLALMDGDSALLAL
ncbi:MAG: MATE family efflux transporter, partial [Oleiphilaceae bacterium]|nr:MATE family efflux transporter [Oleiphilaceae bacterium]